MEKAVVIEFPASLGLIEPSKGIEPGVKKLPAWLRHHGFYYLHTQRNRGMGQVE